MADEHIYTGEEGKNELYILESLVSNDTITPDQAVQQILNLTRAPKTYSRQLGDHCYYTALGLLSTAAHTVPSKQAKLVAFVHELRSKTVTDPSSGEILEHDGEVIWKDLPTFGYTFADEMGSIPGTHITPT
jgi:hypothetical protein